MMITKSTARRFLLSATLIAFLALAAAPAEAQRSYQPLFDKFNFRFEASWINMRTEIRLDSEALGRGTKLNFEDDLGLSGSRGIPTIGFEWQIGRKHRLGVRWQDIDRDSTAQALTEIKWGEETIPVDSNITLAFSTTQTFVDYAYYPWVKERWAAGFGLGLRVLDFQGFLAWREENLDREGSTDLKGTGPVPYLYFEYRRLIGDHWRLTAGLGWLQVKIGDIDGGQYIGRLGAEYLVGRRWSFGGSLNLAAIDVDWAGIESEDAVSLLTAAIEIDVNDFSIFARIRF